jgi:hypothetical protein
VAGAGNGSVLALDPDESDPAWTRAVGGGLPLVAVPVSGAVVAAATGNGTFQVCDPNRSVRWQVPLAGTPSALALSADGSTAVVGCDEGTVYLFETGIEPDDAAAGPDATAEEKAEDETEEEADGANTLPQTADETAPVTAPGERGPDGAVTGAGGADEEEDGTATAAPDGSAPNRTARDGWSATVAGAATAVGPNAQATGAATGNRTEEAAPTGSPGQAMRSGPAPLLPAAVLSLLGAFALLRRRG